VIEEDRENISIAIFIAQDDIRIIYSENYKIIVEIE
jgi:hypothetical protein